MPKLIRSALPVFPKEDMPMLLSQIGEVLESGQLRFGKNIKIFEDNVARYLGVGGAVAFDSDSSAYETALRYFGATNKEVVVCTNSFISVPNSVIAVSAKAVFADIKRAIAKRQCKTTTLNEGFAFGDQLLHTSVRNWFDV